MQARTNKTGLDAVLGKQGNSACESFGLRMERDFLKHNDGPFIVHTHGDVSHILEVQAMGFSLSWLAIKGGSRDSLSVLGLRGTGVFEEIPESCLTGAPLPSGWYMVASNRGEYPAFLENVALARLSASREVVTCFVEEHVMCSHASHWRGGRELWSVMHAADTGGIEHLETNGALPPFFVSIRDEMRAKQQAAGGGNADVDFIFAVPVEMAARLTGYRHDCDIPGAGEKPFEVLETNATPKRSWLRKVLGV